MDDEPRVINLGTVKFTTEIDLHINPIVQPRPQVMYAHHPLLWILATLVAVIIGYLALEYWVANNKSLLLPVPYRNMEPLENTRHNIVPD